MLTQVLPSLEVRKAEAEVEAEVSAQQLSQVKNRLQELQTELNLLKSQNIVAFEEFESQVESIVKELEGGCMVQVLNMTKWKFAFKGCIHACFSFTGCKRCYYCYECRFAHCRELTPRTTSASISNNKSSVSTARPQSKHLYRAGKIAAICFLM